MRPHEKQDGAIQPDGQLDSLEKRAYFIYLRSGSEHGHDLDHWLMAEEKTNSERRKRKF